MDELISLLESTLNGLKNQTNIPAETIEEETADDINGGENEEAKEAVVTNVDAAQTEEVTDNDILADAVQVQLKNYNERTDKMEQTLKVIVGQIEEINGRFSVFDGGISAPKEELKFDALINSL